MNFCGKCGTKLTDGFRFCSNCGAEIPVEKHDTFETPSVSSEQYAKQTPNQNSLQATPSAASTLVRSFAKSPLFLAAISTFTLSVLFNLLQINSKINFTFDSLKDFVNNYLQHNSDSLETTIINPSKKELQSVLDSVSLHNASVKTLSAVYNIWFLSLIIFTLLTILMAIGFWIIFASASNKNRPALSSAGLTMIKIVTILELVFFLITIILIGLILIITLNHKFSDDMLVIFTGLLQTLLFGSSSTDIFDNIWSDAPDAVYGYLNLLLIVIVVATILEVFFCIKKITSINTAKRTLAKEQPSEKVSVFVAVICFLSAGSIFLSVFSAEEAITVISILCSLASSVCFGILILQYRNAMKQLMLEKTDCKS